MEKIIARYLKYLQLPISRAYCEKLITSHTNYPSMLSVADALEHLGIEHQITRVNRKELEQLSFPYILHFDKHGGELALIRNQQDLNIRNSDFAYWNGVVLRVEPTDFIVDKENQKQFAEESFLNTTVIIFLTAVGVLVLLPAFQVMSWLYACLLVTALGGAITGYLLIAKEVGINYQAVESFCNTGTRANCEKILGSEDARLMGRISFSDTVLIYFAFQLVALGFIIPLLDFSSTILLALWIVSLSTIPVVLYSIYYQGVKAKAWCRLCLVIDGVLVVQMALFTYLNSRDFIQLVPFDTFSLVLTGAMFLATGAAVLLIKQLVQQVNDSKQAEVVANRIKNDPDVFLNQLKQSRRVNTTTLDHEMLIGNREAPIQLIMAANLTCHPCKLGFENACQLFSAYSGKVSLTIRLTRSGQMNMEMPPPSRYLRAWWLHQIHGRKDESERTMELLHSWYEAMDIADLMEKYPLKSGLVDQVVEDLEMCNTNWMNQEGINRTPTWFINGYELPANYSITDLMTLAAGLSEKFTFTEKNRRKEPAME